MTTPDHTDPDYCATVTAGYNPETDAWHVEIHTPGQDAEVIPVAYPQVPDRQAARSLAEQIAENRRLPYLEENKGLRPAEQILEQVREAACTTGEDDPTLLEEIARLVKVAADVATLGLYEAHAEPEVAYETPAGSVIYQVGDTVSIAAARRGTVEVLTAITAVTLTPQQARQFGLTLFATAKEADREAARVTAVTAPSGGAG